MVAGGGGGGSRVDLQFDGHDAGMVFAATLGLFLQRQGQRRDSLTL